MANNKKNYRKLGDKHTSDSVSSNKRFGGTSTVGGDKFLDSETNSKIVGICLAALSAIFCFICLFDTTDGAVSSAVARAIRLTFGAGCFLVPIFLLICSVICFLSQKKIINTKRIIVGLLIVFFSIISLISFAAPIANLGVDEPSLLFSERNLLNYGGYVGSSIFWVLITLFGRVVSFIILITVVLIGIVISGFSFNSILSKFKEHKSRQKYDDDTSESFSPKIMLDKNGDIAPSSFAGFEGGETLVMGEDNAHRGRKNIDAQPPDTDDCPDGNEGKFLTRKLGKDDVASSSTSQQTKVITSENLPDETQKIEENDSDFILPSFDLLSKPHKKSKTKKDEEILRSTAQRLQQTLSEFGIMAKVAGWIPGPTVTLFEIELPAGVRVSKIQNLGADIALALASLSVRIFAPVPGTNYVGIEVPNKNRETVVLSEVLKDAPSGPLQIAIGKDVEGKSVVTDLAKMPHLLIGGTTGSGKSVSVNAMIMSILMRATPDEVRFIMIDPKRVEFTPYNGIPHLYTPVVTEPKEAASALSWGVAEMERRLKLMSEVAARNITEYNAKVKSGELEDVMKTNSEGVEVKKHVHLPYIVIIIDELADLMMSVGKEVEMSICRIAQLARAAGIHLIVATQRPSTNVVTGLIKSNITNRIAFNVASSIDSRVILDTTGAEDLIGLGDLLLSKPEFGKPLRIQGCFVSEKEISSVVSFIKEQGEPDYHSDILSTNLITIGDSSTSPKGGAGEDDDPLVWEAAEIVINSNMGSTSNIQRRLKVGYARAGRIMDQLEDKGIVGPANGSKPREVLVDALELETLKAFEMND